MPLFLFPPISYLSFLALLSPLFIAWSDLKSRLRLVKSKCICNFVLRDLIYTHVHHPIAISFCGRIELLFDVC